ncbi:hypothetical protein [Afipia carboxidovorans]|uniref:hypothetical protein n=1 Tax=Afipia carboxidovorans TaxID=40137 RepID=UPI00308EC199|nr:hypothetical protein CRBSH125_35000 [Afipia carboxidovorans]
MASDLLTDIREFLEQSQMGPSYFGKAACGNSELVERLENGGTVTLITAERVRSFMAERRSAAPATTETS